MYTLELPESLQVEILLFLDSPATLQLLAACKQLALLGASKALAHGLERQLLSLPEGRGIDRGRLEAARGSPGAMLKLLRGLRLLLADGPQPHWEPLAVDLPEIATALGVVGDKLIVGLAGGGVQVRKAAASWPCERLLAGHTARVTAVVTLNNGSRLASGSGDRTVKVWSTSDWICERTLEDTGYVHALLDCGTSLLSASDQRGIKVWGGPPEWRCERTLTEHNDLVKCLTRVDDHVASGSWKDVILWRISDWTMVWKRRFHEETVNALLWRRPVLQSCSDDGRLSGWSLHWGGSLGYDNGVVEKAWTARVNRPLYSITRCGRGRVMVAFGGGRTMVVQQNAGRGYVPQGESAFIRGCEPIVIGDAVVTSQQRELFVWQWHVGDS